MRREAHIDFFLVPDNQLAIHGRLEHWSEWVRVKRPSWPSAAIWRLGKPNGRQWHEPALRPALNELDCLAIERAVSALPEKHRDALRWNYVYRTGPSKARRMLGVTDEGLAQLIAAARQMLINRRT